MTFCVTQLKQAGTKSFRLSAAKLFGEFGANLQNPDKDALEIFIPSAPDRSFVQADQSGAEALVVASQCRYGNYRKLFEHGIKPHTYLALHIFSKQYETLWPFRLPPARYIEADIANLASLDGWSELDLAIRESGIPYEIGKRTVHAKSYRMGPRTFQLSALKQSEGQLNLSFDECRRFLDTFAAVFPEVIEWQAEVERTVRAARMLYNLFGFPRAFNQVFTDGYIREAISFIPQSTVGCITHRAVRLTQQKIEQDRRRWDILNNKHDSYLVECPDEEVAEVGAFMRDALAAELPGRDGPFVMKSEVKAGKNWKDWSKANPAGMLKIKL